MMTAFCIFTVRKKCVDRKFLKRVGGSPGPEVKGGNHIVDVLSSNPCTGYNMNKVLH